MTSHFEFRKEAERRFLDLEPEDQIDVLHDHPEYFARGLLCIPVKFVFPVPVPLIEGLRDVTARITSPTS